jgi:2-keto-4-pentenoate hydratase/2-oxohepta-3-ene-1,7-dioic acid hydratase in catechol pathway
LAAPDLLGLFDRWTEYEPRILAFCRSLSTAPMAGAIALSDLELRLPLRPRQIICIGANYRHHVIEMMTHHEVGSEPGVSPAQRRERATRLMDHRAAHGQPYAFVKPASCLLAPGKHLVLPPDSSQVDWELELAVVIGRPCFRVSRENALQHVAGYAVANDISARDRLNRRDIPGIGLDFISGKGAPGFFPLGPFVVPAALIEDPQDLMLELRLNGEPMQRESTADMIFPVASLIEFVSTHMSLLPGDVISTGSPAGNGTQYGRFLQPGDVVEGRIEGLGLQRFSCVAEQMAAGASMHRPFVPLVGAVE